MVLFWFCTKQKIIIVVMRMSVLLIMRKYGNVLENLQEFCISMGIHILEVMKW